MVKEQYNILFVSHLGRYEGGADRILGLLVERLNPDTFHISVLLPRRASLALHLDKLKIPYTIAPYRAWISPDKNWFGKLYRIIINLMALPYLWLIFRTRHIDIIYSNSLYTPIGSWLANCLGCLHVWHIHEVVEASLMPSFDFGIERSLAWVDHASNKIIYNSDAVRRKMHQHIDSENTRVIYNGVIGLESLLIMRENRTRTSQLRLSIVGSIQPLKRQEDAIRALAVVKTVVADVKLTIVGLSTYPYAVYLKSLAESLGVSDLIAWESFVDDIARVYAETDMLLLCTQLEAFGLVIVEAMAAGCAVIATNAGGVPELIEHGRNGLLFEPGDYETCAKHIITLAQDNELYDKIVEQAAQGIIPRFTVDRFICDIETTLKELC